MESLSHSPFTLVPKTSERSKLPSLYFTAMANGNSKMYRAGEMYECIMKAGLKVEEDIDNVGEFHTILTCVKA